MFRILNYYFALLLTSWQIAWWIISSWRFKSVPAWFDHYFEFAFVVIVLCFLSYKYQSFRPSTWNNPTYSTSIKFLVSMNFFIVLSCLFTFYLFHINSAWIYILVLPASILYLASLVLYIACLIIIHYQMATSHKHRSGQVIPVHFSKVKK